MDLRRRWHEFVKALLVIAGVVALATTFNIFTAIHDAASHGQTLPAWQPATWEYTSAAATLLCCGIIYAAVRIAPPETAPWPRLLGIHVLASLAFSSLHILLMNALRVAVYAAVHRHYPFGDAGFWYEYRKDIVSYLAFASIFWFFTVKRHQLDAPPADEASRTISIQDGKRLLRVRVRDIVAVHAAGNYVEFILSDGRRPLARKSLGDTLRELGECHFVRTHRSWLVNLDHVRSLRSLTTGDFELELENLGKVPLSRRFPTALSRLRERP